jgi:ribosomal protein S6
MDTGHEDKADRLVYEIGYHLVPTLSEEDVALRVGDIQKLVSGHDGGIVAEEFPQMMDLAYTMRKMIAGRWEKYDQAYFGWIKFDTTPHEALAIEEEIRAFDFVLRHILVKTVRESTIQEVVVAKKEPAAPSAGKKEDEKPISEEEVDKAIDSLVKE